MGVGCQQFWVVLISSQLHRNNFYPERMEDLMELKVIKENKKLIMYLSIFLLVAYGLYNNNENNKRIDLQYDIVKSLIKLDTEISNGVSISKFIELKNDFDTKTRIVSDRMKGKFTTEAGLSVALVSIYSENIIKLWKVFLFDNCVNKCYGAESRLKGIPFTEEDKEKIRKNYNKEETMGIALSRLSEEINRTIKFLKE